jgi:hypothetical protein
MKKIEKFISSIITKVNLKFQSSLANDPDLRIVSKLTNFLFLTVNILTKRKATYPFFSIIQALF